MVLNKIINSLIEVSSHVIFMNVLFIVATTVLSSSKECCHIYQCHDIPPPTPYASSPAQLLPSHSQRCIIQPPTTTATSTPIASHHIALDCFPPDLPIP